MPLNWVEANVLSDADSPYIKSEPLSKVLAASCISILNAITYNKNVNLFYYHPLT